VARFTVTGPKCTGSKQPDAGNAGAALAAVASLANGVPGQGGDACRITFAPPVDAADRCTGFFDVAVPLGRSRKATMRLRSEAEGVPSTTARRVPLDRDTLALTCERCARATKLRCRVENGEPVAELPDVCGRQVLADTVASEQVLACGGTPPACGQSHTLVITERTPAVGPLAGFKAVLDPVVDGHGKLKGKKCRARP
jgi:hypothetical protein